MQILKRCSLRSAFVFVTLAAGWFAYQGRLESQRRQLVESIERAGGSVSTLKSSGFTFFQTQRITSVSIPYRSMDEFSDAQLGMLDNLDEIVVLEFRCKFPKDDAFTIANTPYIGAGFGMRSERLPVSPDAVELLRKIRDRRLPISMQEVRAGSPKKR